MGVKSYKPTSSSMRSIMTHDFAEITKTEPEKGLICALKKHAGRNCYGRITSYHRGGGAKRNYRIIDFKRVKVNIPARVEAIEYDPNRSARIALVTYTDGEKAYILAPAGLVVGNTVISSDKTEVSPGNCMLLRNIPQGTEIHNIGLKIGGGGTTVRSAGSMAQVIAKEGDYAQVRMPSGEIRMIHLDCRATIGQVSNIEHSAVVIGSAGKTRHKGRRPWSRGIAKNPVDHPHGGRTNGGRHPVTPWGFPTKGKKTRNSKRTDSFIIKRKRG